MKKNIKILLAVFAATLITCLIAISAAASAEHPPSTPPDGYYFQVYDIALKQTTKYKDPEKFDSVIEGIKNDSVITLLWNIEDSKLRSNGTSDIYITPGASASGTAENPVKIYWDLNGYYYSYVKLKTGPTIIAFDCADFVELNIYSSREGGMLFTSNVSGADAPQALFWLRQKHAALNLGEATVPVEFNRSDGTYTKDKTVTYSGDNISVHCGSLFGAIDQSTNDAFIKVNIKGGTYSQSGSSSALISCTANETGDAAPIINVEDAKLISAYTNIISMTGEATGRVSFKNCLLYSTAKSAVGSCVTTSSLSFDGCKFAGSFESIDTGSNISVKNCMFANSDSYLTTETLAKTYVSETLPLKTYTFTYNSDGTVNTSSYTKPSSTDVLLEYFSVTVNDGEYFTITWDAKDTLGKTLKENWVKGTVPIPPKSLTVIQTAAYKYAFDKTEAVTGDKTYTLRGYAAFGIKANLNLSDKFTFNIYIPKNIYDNSIKGVFIDGEKPSAITETKIDGENYCCISNPIYVIRASEEFEFSIELKGYKSHRINEIYSFSVSGYIEKILAGDYGTQTKSLANATKTYISAFAGFIGGNEINAISYTPSKTGSMTPVNAYVKAARLVFRESIAIRLYSDSAPEIELALPYGSGTAAETKNQSLGADDWIAVADNTERSTCGNYYYEIILPVKFLNCGIKVFAGENNGSFYLDDYIRYAQTNFASDPRLINLVNAIGNYSKAAFLDSDNHGGFDTPAIDFSVNGECIDKIIYSKEALTAAEKLKEIIEAKTENIISLVPEDNASAPTNALILSVSSPNAEYDARAFVDGDRLILDISLKSFVSEAVNCFISDFIKYAESDISFKSGDSTDYFTDKLYYSDFGAVGDGVTEDFFNLKAAHDYANASKRHTVYAESGKTYYIHETRVNASGSAQKITIKTNVVWTGAKFIVDDSDLNYFNNKSAATTNIFEVASDYPVSTITNATVLSSLAGIGEGTAKIDLGLDYPAMLIIYNENHEVYRRSGSSYSGAGQAQKEVLVIDKYGKIDKSTPFMFDYPEVTKIEVYRLDIEPITIKGGEVTTQGCQVDAYDEINDKEAGYYSRGFMVKRSFTVVDGLKHYVVGEVTPEQHRMGIEGAHYSGFFYASNANDILFKNCVLTGRRYYKLAGTYDFGAKLVNKIRLEGCVQSNFWIDENGNPSDEKNGETSMRYNNINGTKVRNCWGIGGTNFCKNMEYYNSTLSRFDAHCGLLNGKIINSTVNFMSLVGKGDMLIENTRWISTTPGATDNSMIYLRGDYGSPWDGTITIKDTVAVPSANDFNLVWHSSSNWYYGYECVFPNIVINNLSFEGFENGSEINFVYDSAITSGKKIHLADFGNGSENKNPIRPPEFIKIINNRKRYVYKIPDVPFFEETDFSGCQSGSYVRK